MSKFYLLIFLFFSALASSATTYTVTDTTANSTSSLAIAIAQANSHLGRDTIEFNIPGPGSYLISLDSLPDVMDTLYIDGISQPNNLTTSPLDLKLFLRGSKALAIHSAGCTISGLKITATNAFGLTVQADSAKNIDNTTIISCFVSDQLSAGYAGIKIEPTSPYSLNSTNISITDVYCGITINSSPSADVRDVTISGGRIWYGEFNRQNFSTYNPHYSIAHSHIYGPVWFRGYLDSTYIGYNSIWDAEIRFSNCSANDLLFEYNDIGGSGADSTLTMHDFLNDTIRKIKVVNNTFEGGNVYFDFRGSNQVFDSIFFNNNGSRWGSEIKFAKTDNANPDTQFVHHLFVDGNYRLQSGNGFRYNFILNGKLDISNVYVRNNQFLGWGRGITLSADSISLLRNFYFTGNNLEGTHGGYDDLILIQIGGRTDVFEITGNTLSFNNGDCAQGILYDSKGDVTNLKINNNNFIIDGNIWNGDRFCTEGILFWNIHARGEVKHNQFVNCSDAGIFINPYYSYMSDSNTVLEIDSNTFSGSFYNGIGIISAPYNPPSQNIGTYTMLGNSIYNIGQEGIYRFSQHDTASCMTCIPKPQLLTAESNGGITSITGTLTGDTLTDYIIEYFSNTAPDTGGYTEGKFFIYRDTITTDATGNAVFVTDISGNYLNAFITSTATSMTTYQTSEFSNEAGVVLGVGEVTVANDILIFPNPVTDKLYVHSTSGKEMQIEILDPLGNVVIERSVNSSSLITIDVKNFTSGIYFVRMNCTDATVVRKIIKR